MVNIVVDDHTPFVNVLYPQLQVGQSEALVTFLAVHVVQIIIIVYTSYLEWVSGDDSAWR